MSSGETKQYIVEILNKLNAQEVLGEYITLRRTGKNFSAVCPFHGDSAPSFSLNAEKGLWHCFGCGAGGNLIHFVMKIENISFTDALKRLAAKAGVKLDHIFEDSEEYRAQERLREIVKSAAIFYHQTLLSGSGTLGMEFLKKRGISESVIKRFGLGYATSAKEDLLWTLKRDGFTEEEMVRAGVAVLRDDTPIDLMRNRVVIPITDHLGRFTALAGRAINDEQGAKYLNSPETPIFSKSKILFGLNLSKKPIAQADQAILVEGYFDMISLWQNRIFNAVASMGTALTGYQASLIRQFCNGVVIGYDGDAAGETATLKAIDILVNAGLKNRILSLDAGDDPDSFVRKYGEERFQERVASAAGVVAHYIRKGKMSNDLKTPEGKSDFVKGLIPILSKVRDQITLAEYIKQISEEAGISESILRKMIRGKLSYEKKEYFQEEFNISPEEKLIGLMLQYPKTISTVADTLEVTAIEDENLRKIYELLLSMPEKEHLTAADLADFVEDEELFKKIMELLLDKNLQISEPLLEELAQELILKIKDAALSKRFEQLKKEVMESLEKNELSHDDELFTEYQRLYNYFKGKHILK